MRTEIKKTAIIFILLALIPMSSSTNKVIVIGLDGASYDFMKQCMANDEYENLNQLAETGSFAPMDSTLPPLTPSAISSFLTGKNPGGTGVYGFEKVNSFSYDTSVVNSRDLEDTFPEKLNGSVMINVPMTYPAPELNGAVVSGFPGSTSGKYAFPPTIKKKLEDMNYSVTTAGTFENQEALEKEVFDLYEKRQDLALDMMDEQDWEFFMVMFTGDARLQHFSAPENCEAELDRYYKSLDDFVGEVQNRTGENTTVIVTSNHGFQELDKKIYMYTFLKENGYLTPKQPDYWKHYLQNLGGNILETLGLKRGGETNAKSFSSAYMEEVDWDNTKAYTGGFYNGQIFINLKGREPNGVVEPENYEEVRQNIIDDLKQLRDPETGKKVVKNIYTKEEIYNGSEMDDVPDIIIETPGYNHIARFGFGKTFLDDTTEKSSPVREGFVMSNRKIRTEDNDILDLSTTVTSELGLEFGEGRNMFKPKNTDEKK